MSFIPVTPVDVTTLRFCTMVEGVCLRHQHRGGVDLRRPSSWKGTGRARDAGKDEKREIRKHVDAGVNSLSVSVRSDKPIAKALPFFPFLRISIALFIHSHFYRFRHRLTLGAGISSPITTALEGAFGA